MTSTTALDQLAAVEAFTAWLKVDRERYPQQDRRLGDSYERAPVLRSDLENLLGAVQSMAQIADERNGQLSQARELARIMYRVLNQLPTGLGDYDERLEWDLLPEWLTGGE